MSSRCKGCLVVCIHGAFVFYIFSFEYVGQISKKGS
jgi:hypothetical protein